MMGKLARTLARVLGLLPPAFTALFIFLPIGFYFLAIFDHPAELFARLFPSRQETLRLAGLLGWSVGIAAMAATLAALFAIMIFTAIHQVPKRLRFWLWSFCALPMLIPAHFEAIAWIQILGHAGWLNEWLSKLGISKEFFPSLLYSPVGCAKIFALHYFPVIVGALWIGWRTAGASALDAARMLMPSGRLWRNFIFHWERPWLTMGWLIVFLSTLLDYSVPSLLRRPVFTVEIMTAYNVYYDPPRAVALTLPLLAISLATTGMLGILLSRAPWPAFIRASASLPNLSSRMRIALILVASLILFSAWLAPTVNFIKMAEGWSNYRTVFVSARDQISISLLWSAVAALATVYLAIGLNSTRTFSFNPFRVERKQENGAGPVGFTHGYSHSIPSGSFRNRALGLGLIPRSTSLCLRGASSVLMLLLFALPGSVVGIAQIVFWNRPDFGNLMASFYDSGLMLPLGLTTVLLPVAYFIFWMRLRQTPRVLEDLESLSSPRGFSRWRITVAPRLAVPSLFAVSLVFVFAMHEVHASILLAAPGQETLSIRAFTLLHYAPDRLLAALCMISFGAMIVGLTALWGIASIAKRILRKGVPHCVFD